MIIQIVEDHPMFADGLRALLSNIGIECRESVTSVKVVEPTADTIVVCDLRLATPPWGAAAVEYLCDVVGVPVVAISGSVRHAVVGDAVGAGATTYVCKETPFSQRTWSAAFRAASQGLKFVTAKLAEALLSDSHARPLPPHRELTTEAQAYLRRALLGLDMLYPHERDPTDPRIAAVNNHIWRVARARSRHWAIDIPPLLRRAAPYLQRMSQEEAARSLGCAVGTLRGQLTRLTRAYRDKHCESGSRSVALRQEDLLRMLLEEELR